MGGLDYTKVVRGGEIVEILGDHKNVDGGSIDDVIEGDL